MQIRGSPKTEFFIGERVGVGRKELPDAFQSKEGGEAA